MKNLRPETMAIVKRVETLSGCPVEFKPDSSLTLRATLQMARTEFVNDFETPGCINLVCNRLIFY